MSGIGLVFVIWGIVIAIYLYGQFCWDRGYAACTRDRDEYDTRRDFIRVSNVEAAMKFLKEKRK